VSPLHDFFVLAEKERCPQFSTHFLLNVHHSQKIFGLKESLGDFLLQKWAFKNHSVCIADTSN
jgi:hypothetical protein